MGSRDTGAPPDDGGSEVDAGPCEEAPARALGGACEVSFDCEPGLGCFGGTCVELCDVAAGCPAMACERLGWSAGGVEYGRCVLTG